MHYWEIAKLFLGQHLYHDFDAFRCRGLKNTASVGLGLENISYKNWALLAT